MVIRKMVFDGISYNVMTDDELNEIELKKELDIQHERLMNGEIETMSVDDFAKKHQLKYGL